MAQMIANAKLLTTAPACPSLFYSRTTGGASDIQVVKRAGEHHSSLTEEPMELELIGEDSDQDSERRNFNTTAVEPAAAPVTRTVWSETRTAPVAKSALLRESEIAVAGDTVSTIDTHNGELLMRLVLQHEPYAATAHVRAHAWDAIANAFVEAGGVDVASRSDVTRHLGVLTTALIERPHLLTPVLRAMVAEFNERNCKAGYAARLGGAAFLDVLRRSWASGDAVLSTVNKTKALTRTEVEALQENAAKDAQLIQLVLMHRPFDVEKADRSSLWTTILNEFNASEQRSTHVDGLRSRALVSERSVLQRLRASTSTLIDARRYKYLPSALRVRLVEFNLLSRDSTPDKVGTRWQVDMKRKAVPATAEYNEAFVQMVLTKRPFDATAGARQAIWDEIGRALSATTGVQLAGSTAAHHMQLLTNAMIENPRSLTRTLRVLILEHNELVFKTPAQHALDKTSLERLRCNVHLVEKVPTSTVTRGSGGVGINGGKPRRVISFHESTPEPERVSTRQVPEGTMDLDRNELIMRHVLDARPFWAHTTHKDAMWDAIAASAKIPGLRTGLDVKKHVDWLADIAQNRAHVQRRPVLLTMFKDYSALPVSKLTNVYDVARRHVETEGMLAIDQISFDDFILHEALRMMPGWSEACWTFVARRLNARVGAKLFRCGDVCKDRVQLLLKVARSNTPHPYVTLTHQQKRLLHDFEAAVCDERPRIHEPYVGGVPVSSVVQVESSPSSESEHGTSSRLKRHHTVGDEEDSNGEGDMAQQRQRTRPRQIHPHEGHHESPLLPARKDLIAENARLRHEMQELRANLMPANEAIAPTPSHAIETSATVGPPTAQQMDAILLELRQHRAQHQAFVVLMQAERETQRRETRALLETIDRERQERRDEFAAMVELMKGSCVLPPAAAARPNAQVHETTMEPHVESTVV